MYRISVPVVLANLEKNGGKERILAELRRIGATRVMLALGALSTDRQEREKELVLLRESCQFFKQHGFEVGSWMWTFWCDGENAFTKMTAADGNVLQSFACPLDSAFLAFVREYIQGIARCGVDLILFDDDYRYGFLSKTGILCTCEHHMKKICAELGEEITPAELQRLSISGEKNKYRDAWMKVNGESLRAYAINARAALDEVDPTIRMGVCSCMSLWDNDGVDSETVCRLLAGNTKPFLRLIGAPYWAVKQSWGNRLAHVFELERMERSWCGDGIEIVCEGDAYPRPRTHCPAAYLELFDMAMRADGTTDGIMKYAIDYYSTVDYERGYIDRHCKNQAIYDGISAFFDGKTACGVRVYEAMQKLADMKIPSEVENSYEIENIFFSPAARMLADCSVPSVYQGEGVCGIAFGENVKYLPKDVFKKGLILDLRAAEILTDMGVDVGLARIGEKRRVTDESFDGGREQINMNRGADVYELEPDEKARVLSSFVIHTSKFSDGDRLIPACYFYENASGERFVVYAFHAYFNNDQLWRSYARAGQLTQAVKLLSGKALPASCYGNPDLYMMCKKNDDGDAMAVGLWNIFADSIPAPAVELDGAYTDIRFINCTGRLEGSRVVLSEMAPYSFAGFEVRR